MTKLDDIEATVAISKEQIKVFRLPFVSDRNPQRCDDKITPTYPIELKIPLSLVSRFRSHCATGKMKFTKESSMNAHAIKLPASSMKT